MKARLICGLSLLMLLGGCGGDTRVGSKKLLEIEEQKQKQRLGEFLKSPEATPASPGTAALGTPAPSAPAAAPTEAQRTFEVTLIHDSPYYEPGNELEIPAGTKIIITNRDELTRRFRTTNGPYDSGDLTQGQKYEFTANTRGVFQVADEHVPFATGKLTIT